MTDIASLKIGGELLPVEQLEDILRLGGVDLRRWGVGDAKTVLHLQRELTEGEAVIDVTDTGGVEKRIAAAWADVLHIDPQGNIFYLVEDRQEFGDGRIRRRQLTSSLGEKLKRNEAPDSAAERVFQEELRAVRVRSLYTVGHTQNTKPSTSYPGLISHSDIYQYVAVIEPETFNPEGYVEVQTDKTNYYRWELIYSIEV